MFKYVEFRWLVSDYIKGNTISTDHIFYTEADLQESVNKIDT